MDIKANINTNDLEKKYYTLKKKLEELKYNQPIGYESINLVDKLLNDMIIFKDTSNKLKEINAKLIENVEGEKQVCLPLRNENIKLIKENNLLHKEIIRLKESLERKDNVNDLNIRKLKDDQEEAKYLIDQKDLIIKEYESKNELLREKLSIILKKVYGDQNTGLQGLDKFINNKLESNKTYFTKKNEFVLKDNHELVFSSEIINQYKSKIEKGLIDKTEWANDLREANDRTEKFRIENQNLEEVISKFDNEKELLENQIKLRDDEIKRLTESYFPKNNDSLKYKYQIETLTNELEKLNKQNDFVNEENHKLKEENSIHKHRCYFQEIQSLDKQIIKLKKENANLLNIIKDKNIKNNDKNNNDNNSNNLAYTNKEKEVNNISVDDKEERLYILSNNIEKIKIENQNLNNELEKARSNITKNNNFISELNSEKSLLIKNLKDVQSSYFDLKKNNKLLNETNHNLLKQVDTFKSEINFLKGAEIVNNTKQNEIARINFDNIIKQKENIIEQSDKSERNLKEIIIQKDNLIKEIQSEYKNLSDDYKIKVESLSNLNNELRDLRILNDEIQLKLNNSDKNTYANNTKNSELIVQLEKDCQELKNKKIELDNNNEISLKRIKQLEESIINIEKEKNTLEENLESVKDKSNNELNLLKEEIVVLKSQLSNIVKNEDINVQSKEKIKTENSDLIKKNNNLKTDLENQKSNCSILQFELKKLKLDNEQLLDKIKILNEQVIDKNKELISMEEVNEKLKNRCFEVNYNDKETQNNETLTYKEKLNTEKLNNEKLQNVVKNQSDKIIKLNNDYNNLFNQNNILTNKLTELENKKNELFNKLTFEINKRKIIEGEKQFKSDTEDNITIKLLTVQEENKNLKTGIDTLNKKYDKLSEELDEKTEELIKLQCEFDELKSTNSNLNKKISEKTNKSKDDFRILTEKEELIRNLEEKLISLEGENYKYNNTIKELKSENYLYNKNLIELNSEYEKLFESYNNINKQKEELKNENLKYTNNYEYCNHQIKSLENNLNDITEVYKNSCTENSKLKLKLKEFYEENVQADQYIKNQDNKIKEFGVLIEKLKIEREEYLEKNKCMQNYINSIDEDNNSLKNLIKRMNISSDELKKNIKQDKTINFTYEQQIIEMQKKLNNLENENKNINDIYNNLKLNNEYLNNKNQNLENQNKNFENLLAQERKEFASIARSNEELSKEIKNIKNKLNSFNINDNNNIDKSNNHIFIENENENEKLRNYNVIPKQLEYTKYEGKINKDNNLLNSNNTLVKNVAKFNNYLAKDNYNNEKNK